MKISQRLIRLWRKSICILLIINSFLGFWICDLGFADEYLLAPCDQLEIKIIGQKDIDTKQSIAPDGTISLPMLGRVTAQDQPLSSFNKYLCDKFSKYIKNPQVIIYLTPRPVYIVQHDVRRNTWEVKEAKSIAEAQAFAGKDYIGKIKHGDIVCVETNKNPDFWEDNWYKVLTATAVIVGINNALKK